MRDGFFLPNFAFSPEEMDALVLGLGWVQQRADLALVQSSESALAKNLLCFLPDGGRERPIDYLRMAEPILARFGATILFRGDGLDVLTDGDNNGWDAVLLVQYPRRTAFKDMVEDPSHQAAFRVGKSVLSDFVLQPLTPTKSL